MQPRVNVTVRPLPATATAAAYSPGIKIRTHLWVPWARIAIKHEVMAQDARRQAEQPGAVTLEVLKVAVDPKGMVNLWRQELPWRFQVRGESVHYRGSFQAPQPHPLGTNTA